MRVSSGTREFLRPEKLVEAITSERGKEIMVQAIAYADTMAGEDLARLHLLRDLFASAPDEALLGRLNKQAKHDAALQKLAQAAQEETKEVLAAEWMRLFEGPGRFPVVLFGSYYVDGGKLMGPLTVATRQFYRQYGMELGANIPADHLAYELGLLGYFIASAAMADARECEQFLSARSEFSHRFMLPWITRMVTVLRESTRVRFFLQLGELLLSVIQQME